MLTLAYKGRLPAVQLVYRGPDDKVIAAATPDTVKTLAAVVGPPGSTTVANLDGGDAIAIDGTTVHLAIEELFDAP